MSDWYKNYKKHGKHLYHASPQRLTRLMPRSNFFGVMGIYVSPTYKSVIEDWSTYVMGKKHKNHPMNKQIAELTKQTDALFDLRDKAKHGVLTEEEKKKLAEIEVVWEKREKLMDSSMKDEARKSMSGYKTLYVHTLSCPMDVYEECLKLYNETQKAKAKGNLSDYGFWGWGEQIFIPAEFLPRVQIIAVEELNIGGLYDKIFDEHARKPRYPDRMYGEKGKESSENHKNRPR